MRRHSFALIIGVLILALPFAVEAASDKTGSVAIAPAGQAPDCLSPTQTVGPQTIVGVWNCASLDEVRLSKALRNGPPMVARALAIAHTCMYDAWAAYGLGRDADRDQ